MIVITWSGASRLWPGLRDSQHIAGTTVQPSRVTVVTRSVWKALVLGSVLAILKNSLLSEIEEKTNLLQKCKMIVRPTTLNLKIVCYN